MQSDNYEDDLNNLLQAFLLKTVILRELYIFFNCVV